MKAKPDRKPVKWRLKAGATWHDKLHREHPSHGRVVELPPAQQKAEAKTLLIPRPLDINALVKRVPKGRLVTVTQIREALAKRAGADNACPLTTGIFLRIVAETAEEQRREGRKRLTPWWRVIDGSGALRERFPEGVKAQAVHLRAEGHAISRGRRKQTHLVEDFQDSLVRISVDHGRSEVARRLG